MVPHSAYEHHVTIKVLEGILEINSHGSYGDFTEFRSLNDGRLLRRFDPKSLAPLSSAPASILQHRLSSIVGHETGEGGAPGWIAPYITGMVINGETFL